MLKTPESEILAKYFADMSEKFPGEVGTRNFTKNWRQFRLAVKQSSFTGTIIKFFRGRPRGGDNFSSAADPLFKASKTPFLTLRVATPSGAPRQALLDTRYRPGLSGAFSRPFESCEGFIRHRIPGPHPRICLALPSSGVDLASISHRFPDLTCQIDPWGGEGEADSTVGPRGLVLNKPLTAFGADEDQSSHALQTALFGPISASWAQSTFANSSFRFPDQTHWIHLFGRFLGAFQDYINVGHPPPAKI